MRKLKAFFWIILLSAISLAGVLTISHQYGEKSPNKNRQLTVMTWNVFRFDKDAPVAQNRVIRYLQDHPVDIVCLQEAEVLKNPQYLTLPALKQAMGSNYPYSYFDFKIYNGYRQYGLVVFSRYPLIHKQTVRYPSSANMSSRCDVAVGKDTFRLFINHLESNKLLVGKDSRDTLISKMRHAAPIRRMEARTVAKEAGASPYPVLVVGDFNAPPVSYTYLRMRMAGWNWLRDAHLEGSRWRLGNTIFVHGIGARIDYIMSDRSFEVDTCYVDRSATGSDHYPVVATLRY